jgi:hypothetical protein
VLLLFGFALGVVTMFGQTWLHGAWLALVNSGAVWLAAAFVAGAVVRSDPAAALAGTAVLMAAVVGYYGSVPFVVEGASASSRSVAIWLATALVGGPVYGVAGRWWRGTRSWKAWVGLALLGGAFLAEGASRLRLGHGDPAGWGMLLAGLVIPLVLGRSTRERLFGLILMVPVVAATAIAYAVINWAFLHS